MKIQIIIPIMVATLALVVGFLAPASAIEPPTQIEINQLSKDFVPVQFDHASHVEMVGECGECHHHTAGSPSKNPDCMRCHDSSNSGTRVACHDCHPAEPFSAESMKTAMADRKRYHRDPLGLIGAYHRSCIGCHEVGGGPTKCLDCHSRTVAGDELFRAGKFQPSAPTNGAGH